MENMKDVLLILVPAFLLFMLFVWCTLKPQKSQCGPAFPKKRVCESTKCSFCKGKVRDGAGVKKLTPFGEKVSEDCPKGCIYAGSNTSNR